MKTAKISLRIAAVLMLIHLIGHTLGHSGWKNSAKPAQRPVIAAMTGPHFPFMGKMRSMGDYYDGYGYACSIAMLVFVCALWFLAADLSAGGRLVTRLLWVLALALLAWGIDEQIWFFPFAAYLSLLASMATFTAIFTARKAIG